MNRYINAFNTAFVKPFIKKHATKESWGAIKTLAGLWYFAAIWSSIQQGNEMGFWLAAPVVLYFGAKITWWAMGVITTTMNGIYENTIRNIARIVAEEKEAREKQQEVR
jgi:hypothetical protein